jgi:hypothetical protein
MHVGVADEHRKYEPSEELVGLFLSGFRPQHRRDIGIAATIVFVVGEEREHLREILHVNALAAGSAVESFDRERLAFHTPGVLGEPVYSF